MNTHILFILLSLSTFCLNGQESKTEFEEYSYSEFFQLIENEVKATFSIHDVIVRFDQRTDSLFIVNGSVSSRKTPLVIDKVLELNNVHFLSIRDELKDITSGVICNIAFQKKVYIKTILNAKFYECVFEERIQNRTGKEIAEIVSKNIQQRPTFSISNSVLKKSALVWNMFDDIESPNIDIHFFKNEIFLSDSKISSRSENTFYVIVRNSSLYISNNIFHDNGIIFCSSIENIFTRVTGNEVKHAYAQITFSLDKSFTDYSLSENKFSKPVFLQVDHFNPNYTLEMDQFYNQVYSESAFGKFTSIKFAEEDLLKYPELNDSTFAIFEQYQVSNEAIYDLEMTFKGELFNFYKSKFNTKNANAIYVNSKDLETSRLKYLNNENPSFDSYFTLKINQFLKVFSAYGTRPAKAIIFSMYVILAFAFIYLFFPNSWDRYGKHRIVQRYRFFAKYMNRQAGIHDVYLEEKQNELLEYEEFKNYMLASSKTMPKFFIATALPLYKWAISGTKTTASFLKRIDIIKGKWSDIPSRRRWRKSLIITIVFLIAIVYDIFIKILNAIMLSINTFTTLGFGEIPIKGFPRYLAILEGFIGWFMLTIFSVSLISQLLN